MNDLNKYIDLIDTVEEYNSYLDGLGSDSLLEDLSIAAELKDAVTLISNNIYGSITENADILIRLLSNEVPQKVGDISKCLCVWIEEVRCDTTVLSGYFVKMDQDFERMMLTVERCREDALVKRLFSVLTNFAENTPSNFQRLISVYSDFAHLWGEFDPTKGKYDHFTNGIHAVKEHTEDIRWLYNTVEDYRSRKVIYGLIKFWLELDFSYKNTLKENNYDDYFDLDILNDRISPDERVVDCGAYIGDTAKAYFDNFSKCKVMYLYDMLPTNLSKAKEELSDHNEIIYRNAGVGSPKQEGKRISVSYTVTSAFSLNDEGVVSNPETEDFDSPCKEVEMVTLDNDIKEKITFLKMDIEGSEINALLGAREHIVNDHPKLAICTYHHYEHLWEIPRLIKSMNPDYKLYLRYNGAINGIMASEHFLFAV